MTAELFCKLTNILLGFQKEYCQWDFKLGFYGKGSGINVNATCFPRHDKAYAFEHSFSVYDLQMHDDVEVMFKEVLQRKIDTMSELEQKVLNGHI